jgi:hypothetical protein
VKKKKRERKPRVKSTRGMTFLSLPKTLPFLVSFSLFIFHFSTQVHINLDPPEALVIQGQVFNPQLLGSIAV